MLIANRTPSTHRIGVGREKFAARGSPGTDRVLGFWVPANRTGAVQDRQRGPPFARPAETTMFGEARDSSTNSPTTGSSHAGTLSRREGGLAADSGLGSQNIRHPLFSSFISAREVGGLDLRFTSSHHGLAANQGMDPFPLQAPRSQPWTPGRWLQCGTDSGVLGAGDGPADWQAHASPVAEVCSGR